MTKDRQQLFSILHLGNIACAYKLIDSYALEGAKCKVKAGSEVVDLPLDQVGAYLRSLIRAYEWDLRGGAMRLGAS